MGLEESENGLDQGWKGNGIYFCRLGLQKTRNEILFSGGVVLNAVLVRAGDYLPEAIWLADIVGGELRAQLAGWAGWLAESPDGGVGWPAG